ncbi:MAG: hypothetical protein MUC90_08240 [Thermoplasmata archaeon]|nr:hypothetical protein [Thermoplasmata archaeon]
MKRVLSALSALFVVSLFVIGALAIVADNSEASLFPKNVRGYVRDNVGNPVQNAPVTINVRWAFDNDIIRATYTTTAGTDGLYSKSVLGADWDVGDLIEVIATNPLNSDQEDNSAIADNTAMQYIDVTFPYEIPEFGIGFLGMLAAGIAVAAVGVALFVFWKRK